MLFPVLLAAALSAHAGWDPAQAFEWRFKSTVVQNRSERPPVPSQGVVASLSDAEAEREAVWIALRLGLSSDTTYEANRPVVAELTRLLKALRSRYPEVAGLRAGYTMGTAVKIALSDAAEAAVAAGVRVPEDKHVARVTPAALGLRELDAAVASLKGSYKVSVYRTGRVSVVVELGRELDLAKISRRLESLPHVRAASADADPPSGPGLPVVERGGGEWRLKLTYGWGDCSPVCPNLEAWFFSFSEEEGPRWVAYTRSAGDTLVVRPR